MAEPKKDYLSSLASEIEKKPDSFKEEKVERIVKPKRSLDPKIMIGLAAAVIVALIGVYFLFFAPKIKVENFVGKTTNDVGIWAKENGIDIPKEMEIVCVIDTKYNSMMRPQISSFAIPSYDLGAVSMRVMTKMLQENTDDIDKEIELSYLFTPRQSTL